MTGTVWILFALGAWLVAMGTVYICASLIKDMDRAQSDVLARGRRDGLVDPAPHRRAI